MSKCQALPSNYQYDLVAGPRESLVTLKVTLDPHLPPFAEDECGTILLSIEPLCRVLPCGPTRAQVEKEVRLLALELMSLADALNSIAADGMIGYPDKE